MKKYIQIIGTVLFFIGFNSTYADITHESCTTGIYSSYYASLGSCNTCGYHNTRFYKGHTYGLWDYFVNVNKKNYLLSTNSAYSYATVHSLQTNVNFTQGNYVGSNTAGLTANYLPDTVGVNGNRDGVIFLLKDVSWNQNISNRNTPIGMVEYNLRHYEITSTGSATANTVYAYLNGKEILNPTNGLYDLQATWVKSSGVKNYDPTPINHKECYVMLGAWCGDGVVDSNYGETCDNGILNGTPGNGCSATCQMTTCANGGIGGAQSSAISSTTPGLCQSGVTLGNFTSSTSGNTTNYTWSCNGLSGGNCSASYTVTNGGGQSGSGGSSGGGPGGGSSGGGGGGGSSAVCNSLSATNTSGNSYIFSCSSNSAQYTIDIRDITNGQNTLLKTFTNTSGTYTIPGSGTYSAQCYVGSNNVTNVNTCRKTFSVGSTGGGGGGNYCGDGVLQRPNAAGENEECDFGNGTWPAWCDKSTCQINENTQPGAYNLQFMPQGDILLGDNMSVFGNLSTSYATFTNNTASDVYIPGHICVYKNNKSYNVLLGNNICSSNDIGFVGKGGGVKKIGINNNQFVADTSSIPTGVGYGEAELVTTLEGLQNKDTFLKAILNVRVAKSSVTTIGGGASLLNGTNYSDVNVLSNGGFSLLKPEYNKNLILASLGINPLSSYVKSSSNTTLINASQKQGNQELSTFDKIDNIGNTESITKLPTQKFNSLDNVYTHKGDVILSAQPLNGGNKTYIIESGNLYINGNITSGNNVLFVVKNGNIVISNDVTRIDAILIDIGGNIQGETQSTLNRLVVNGALYGNVADLLSKRTYIKDRGAYVDVGTNINFTSKIFDAPPPLLSKFLSEYTSVKRIAK